MARIFAPVVPPTDPEKCAPWLNRELRRIGVAIQQQGRSLSAVARGELPDGSGTPIVDLTNFWYKPGIPNQFTAFMRTGAGASGIISSTASAIKGYIYLGSSSGVSFNEASTLVGINTPVPAARLHITESATGGTQSVTPTTGVFEGGWGNLGGGDQCTGLQSDDGDTTALQGPDLTTSVGDTVGIAPPTDPGVYTGWTLVLKMRKTMTGNGLGATMDFRNKRTWNGSNFVGTGTQILGRNILLLGPGVGNDIVLSEDLLYADYTVSLTPAEAATMFMGAVGGYLTITFSSFGSGRTDQVIRITKISINGPGIGDSVPLQRWVSSGSISTDNLSFDGDGGSAEDLVLSGSTPFRVSGGGGTSGVRLLTSSTNGRIEAGTPSASNMNLVMSGTRDTTGTQLTQKFANTTLTGTITINGGGPAVGDLLQSTDTNGLATWAAGTVVASTWPYVAVSGTYAILTTDGVVDCTSGTFTVTLPTAVGVTGKLYDVKNSGTGVITIATTGGQTIDGGSTAVINHQYESVTVISDGANWKIL